MTSAWKRAILALFGFIGISTVVLAQQAPVDGSLIPESKIISLQVKLVRAMRNTKASTVTKRRAFKSIARAGAALVAEHPGAKNRFRVLEVILRSQKRLLSLQKTDNNREALFKTVTLLAKAPDEYGEVRFEADILLSRKKLSEKESTYEDHAKALAEILERYHGNPAEARILMRGITIASSLEAYELKKALLDRLDDGYLDDEEVIEFRRKLSLSTLRVSFKNELTRMDGTTLCFPNDTVGKLCVMAFWSKENPHLDKILGYVKGLQLKHPGVLNVFSFNLDNLPDGGKSKLTELGLDWDVMALPKGRNAKAYTTYARTNPAFVLVDAYGRTTLNPSASVNTAGITKTKDGEIAVASHLRIDENLLKLGRFLNQIQSIYIGDFLVLGYAATFDPAVPPELMMVSPDHRLSKIKAAVTPVPTKITRAELQLIQNCFIAPPFRYRLPPADALANYRKAEALCRKAIKKYSKDPGVWMLRNRRIIALLGMWQIARAPEYLKQAVLEAKASLATDLVRGADVVPRFCLAKEALRQAEGPPEDILSAFMKYTGGADAPASAKAAAATLALLDVRKPSLYETCRDAALTAPKYGNPLLWPVRSFFLDRCHNYYSSGHGSNRRPFARGHIINHTDEAMATPMPEITLKTLDGKPLVLPRDTADSQTLLLFIEPPADPKGNFPVMKKDHRGRRIGQDYIRDTMDLAEKLVAQKKIKKVNVITAFLCDDPAQVRHLMKVNGWTSQAAMLPGGLSNPMVRCLNILSADRVPNAFLIRRDGTISWHMSGIKYGEHGSFPVQLALRVHFERNEVEWGYKALVKGDNTEAIRAFSGPFLRDLTNRYHWRGPRYHGLTLSHIAQKDWKAALEAVDVAIFQHYARHCHGIPRPRRSSTEQKSKFGETVLLEEPCEIISNLWRTKALILEKLKRNDEAAVFQKLAKKPAKEDNLDAYNSLHYKLMKFGAKLGL